MRCPKPDTMLVAAATIIAAVITALVPIAFHTLTRETAPARSEAPRPQTRREETHAADSRGRLTDPTPERGHTPPEAPVKQKQSGSDQKKPENQPAVQMGAPILPVHEPEPLNDIRNRVALAVLLVDEEKTPVAAVSEQVADTFGGTAALFSPSFVSTGVFERVLQGATAPLVALSVERRANAVLLGVIRVAVEREPLDASLQIVTMGCDAKLYVAKQDFAYHSLTVKGRGTDFVRDRAIGKAQSGLVERLIGEVKRLIEE